MLKNVFQSAPLSIFYSTGSHQLELWKTVKAIGDEIEFVTDNRIDGKVLEMRSDDITRCFMRSCSLAIKSPVLGMSLRRRKEKKKAFLSLPHRLSTPPLVLVVRRLSTVMPFAFEVELQDQSERTYFLHFSTVEERARFAPSFASIPLEFDDQRKLLPLEEV
jgi:hypothetical protein